MGASNSNQKPTQFYRLKIDKELNLPVFYRNEKVGEEWQQTETFSQMEGFLKNISIEDYVWDGKAKQSIKISMNDNGSDEKIIITTSFNNATRSMLNSLAGCDQIGLVTLQCSKWGKGDKKYPTIFVKVDGNKTNWKYPIETIPPVEQVKNKKGEVLSIDDTDVNEFFAGVIEEINKKVKGDDDSPRQKSYAETEENHTANVDGEYIPDEDAADSLPF